MPLNRIRTIFRVKPHEAGKRTTIRIPQPEERPLSLRKRDVVLWKEINLDPWWYTLHHRGPRRARIGESVLEARAVSKSYVRGTLPERIVYKYLVERLSLVSGIDFDFQSCVGSHHKILTADLRWVEAGSLVPGDELLSFSEYGQPRRKWTKGTVTFNKVEEMESYKVKLSDGREIITTFNHPWLVHYAPGKLDWGVDTGYSWVETKNLKVGTHVPIFLDTWEEDTSKDAGYLAGFFDGEGSVVHSKTQTGGHAVSLTIGQNAGEMFDKFMSMTTECGFDFSVYDYRGKYKRSYDSGMREVIQMRISGGRSEALRFLGSIRPAKLQRLNIEKLGKLTKIRNVRVVSVDPIGKTPIARLEVDKHTYIVEGFGMHNSLQGGRMELGGIVADFIFPLIRMVIQVQGPTHDTFLRSKKDIEQMGDLANMGYMVKEIQDETVYDEYMFEEWMRRAFGLANGMGGSPGSFSSHEADQDMWQVILERTKMIHSSYYQTFGA